MTTAKRTGLCNLLRALCALSDFIFAITLLSEPFG